MSADNWTIKDIRIGNTAQPSGEAPKHKLTAYHSPRLFRTIKGGPGNRSVISDCSCGARFEGAYEYIGHDLRMCDWYARHAGIEGGGEAIANVLRQYDEALDVIRYPDDPQTRGKIAIDPRAVLDTLRTEA